MAPAATCCQSPKSHKRAQPFHRAREQKLIILCTNLTVRLNSNTQLEHCESSLIDVLHCDEQRQIHAELWSRVTNHRLIDQLVTNTIPKRVLSRYLAQDHRFLDAFVVLLASTVARVNCLSDRIPGCQFLALITGRENTYFERSLDALGDEAVIAMEAPDGPATIGFCSLMRETAYSSDFASMLAVLVVAEWSYQDWGERVLPLLDEKIDVPFWCREWVELHSGPYFGSVVTYLRKLLDDEATRLSATSDGDAALERAAAAFAKALQLELDFFEQAYDDAGS